MLAVLDPVTSRGTNLCVIFCFLLLTFSSSAVAFDNSVVDVKSSGCLRRMKVLDRVERKLAAVPAPEPAVPANGPVPSPLNPLPPSTPPNRRPALITPSGNAPGQDLPPMLLSPPPVVVAPTASAPASASKQSNVAVILEVTLGVVVLLLVSLSAAAFFKPEWLPCCRGRRSQLTQYERHVQT